MLISKNGKRLMSYLLAVVMVLSGFVYAPKASAAETIPEDSVKVLGATLRLGNGNENHYSESEATTKQSLRIGIQVSNASKAKDCSITLTINDTSYTISTDESGDMQNKHIFSKNVESDTIIYSVVLTNIPKKSFDTEIGITGKAVGFDNSKISSTDSRTVTGIVNKLSDSYPNLKIEMNENGEIYILKDGVKQRLTASDISNYSSDINSYAWQKLDLSKFTYDSPEVPQFTDDVLSVPSGSNWIGIEIPDADKIRPNQTLNVNINAKCYDSDGIRSWIGSGGSDNGGKWPGSITYESRFIPDENNDVTISYKGVIKEAMPAGTSVLLKPSRGGNSFTGEIIIESVNIFLDPSPIYNDSVYEVDLTKDIINGKEFCTYNDDGTITVNYTDKYQSIKFNVPEGQEYLYDTVTVVYKDVSGPICYNLMHPDGRQQYGNGYAQETRYDKNLQSGNDWITTSYSLNDPGNTVNCNYIQTLELFTLESPPEIPRHVTIHSVTFSNTTPEEIKLSPDNIAYKATVGEPNYHDDGIDVELSYDYSGLGICFYLNNNHNEIDLSQYSKLSIETTTDKEYPMVVEFKNGITSNNYWGNEGESRGTAGTDYKNFGPGTTTYTREDLSNINAKASAIFIKYNTYNSDIKENAKLTINSIKLYKKPALTTKPLPEPVELPSAEKLADGASITVDGIMDDAYAAAPELPIDSRVVCDNKGDSTTTATAKVMWDPNNLYVYVNVKDENIDATAANDYQQDGVEIFLDEDNSKEVSTLDNGDHWAVNPDAFQYRFTGLTKDDKGNANNPNKSDFAGGSDAAKADYAGIKAAYAFTKEGYAVEFKVPFKEEKADGAVVGFDIIVQDCKDGGRDAEIYYSETNRTKNYWNLHDTFAELTLLGDAPVADSYEVDLSAEKPYVTKDESVSAEYSGGTYNITIPKFAGIGFEAPNDMTCKYVEITYTSNSAINTTLFDANYQGSTDRDAPGEHQDTPMIPKAETETTFKIEVGENY